MKLSIVIPAYNEEHRLSPTLDVYLAYFGDRYGDEVELIVVVNGSSDRTDEIARDYEARFSQVKALVEPEPIGKGGAVLMGFRAATGGLVGFTDADGATPPAAFNDLVEQIGDAGAIVASRWMKGSQVSPRQPLPRRIASRIFNGMVRILFGLAITDTQCGAKLFTHAALETILPRIGMTRWAFDVDLLWNLRAAGYTIREIPTIWQDVGGSKLNVPRASIQMALALIRFRLLHSPFRGVVSLYNRTMGRLFR